MTPLKGSKVAYEGRCFHVIAIADGTVTIRPYRYQRTCSYDITTTPDKLDLWPNANGGLSLATRRAIASANSKLSPWTKR
jgi:hypothetical protein